MRRLLGLILLLFGCVRIPENVEPVSGFMLDRYLGTWYEIARLDHPFERGLANVSAEYSMRGDGGVRVVNRGFSPEEKKWKEAEGRAYFVRDAKTGFLKVSFFGPFYGSYVIFELDIENYGYSLVCGPDKDYLWILSRTKTINEDVKKKLLEKAGAAGFSTEKLIWVEQGKK